MARRSLALCAALLLLPGVAAADAETQATGTVREVVDRVLAILRTPGLDSAARRSRIQDVAYDWFDFETMSRLVVARPWRDFTADQRRSFVVEFRELLSARYGRKIDDYGDEQVDVVSARQDSGGDVTVRTRIHRAGADEITVDYRLRPEDGRFRAIDVVIEGVSLVFSYRGQFQQILGESGPAGLIERLREKNAAAEGGPDPLPDP
jgi:phospholipid transport system substrate-binding protein